MEKKVKQGLGLLDIAPLNEQVEIGNDKEGTAQFIEVRGISSRDILTLIQNFPDMQKFVSIGGINPQDILSLAPGAVGGIIAAGTGHVGELEHEQAADRLSIEAQLDLLEAIGRCTFRNGFGPFVMRISALVAVALSAKSGRVTDTKLPPQLKPSLPPDTALSSSGP